MRTTSITERFGFSASCPERAVTPNHALQRTAPKVTARACPAFQQRETFIAKLTEIQQNVEHLLSQLQASEHDKFAAHLYRSHGNFGSACERAGKSGKQIERCLISTFQVQRYVRRWRAML